MSDSPIIFDNIAKAYHATSEPRRIFAPMGPNGCGKTNFLQETSNKCKLDGMSCLLFATSILINSIREVTKRNLYEWHKKEPDSAPPPNLVVTLEASLTKILGYQVNIGSGGDITFRKGDISFSPNQLSSGEQQVLLISAFLLNSHEEQVVFLVDEPELHMNEALAIKIWERLETCFPKAVFLYATHSPNFATRSTVHETYLMHMDRHIEQVPRSTPVSPAVLRDIVGTRVQLLREEGHPIFCEDSLAKSILCDLFPGPKYCPVQLINCNTVLNATRRVKGWDSFRSEGAWCGVIDRDTRDDSQVTILENDGVFVFPRYESEALLLDPKIALWSFKIVPLSKSEWVAVAVNK